jgi:uncharacterized protein YxjI
MKLTVKQRIMAFGKQYRAYDETENQVYEIKSMVLSPQRRKEVLNMSGEVLAWAEWPVMSRRAELNAGGSVCTINIPVMSLKPNWTGECAGEPFSVTGDFFKLSFKISKAEEVVSTVEKRVIAFSDTYEVDVNEAKLPPEFALLIVALIDHKYYSDEGK